MSRDWRGRKEDVCSINLETVLVIFGGLEGRCTAAAASSCAASLKQAATLKPLKTNAS